MFELHWKHLRFRRVERGIGMVITNHLFVENCEWEIESDRRKKENWNCVMTRTGMQAENYACIRNLVTHSQRWAKGSITMKCPNSHQPRCMKGQLQLA